MSDLEKRSVLDTINQWIFNCDTKVSIYLATIGIFFSILTSNIGNEIVNIINLSITEKSTCTVAYLILFVVGIIILTIGIYKLIRVLIPRIDLTHDSVMFFGNVSSYSSFDEYYNTIETYSSDKICKDLLCQIYAASKICNQKFKNFKHGIVNASLGSMIIIIWLVLGFIVYYI